MASSWPSPEPSRALFINYRRLRASLGLRHFGEADMIAMLASHGLAATRDATNLGHNQARMAFTARRIVDSTPLGVGRFGTAAHG